MDEWYQWIVILFIAASTTAKCPSGHYYEPYKGCVSCDVLCLNPFTEDQCRYFCYNEEDTNSEEEKVETSDRVSSSDMLGIAPTALIITLICVLVLLGSGGGGYLLYKFKFYRRADYIIAPQDQYNANEEDIEMQLYNHRAGESQNGDSDEETVAEENYPHTEIQQQQELNPIHDPEITSASMSTLPNSSSSLNNISDYDANTDADELPSNGEPTLNENELHNEDDPDTEAIDPRNTAQYTGVTDLRTQNGNIPISGDQNESGSNGQANIDSVTNETAQSDEHSGISELSASESERIQCRQCGGMIQSHAMNQSNSTSCFATSHGSSCNNGMTCNVSINGNPHDPSATSLKSPVSSASPECDQFSIEDISGYSQEATNEDNSQPAPNSPHSLRAFRPLLAANRGYTHLGTNQNNHLLLNEIFQAVTPRNFGVMPGVMPHPVNNISSDEQSLQDGEGDEDSITTTSDDSTSTEPDDS